MKPVERQQATNLFAALILMFGVGNILVFTLSSWPQAASSGQMWVSLLALSVAGLLLLLAVRFLLRFDRLHVQVAG